MNTIFEAITHLIQSPQFAAFCCDALLKSIVVLAFAGILCLVWKRAAAATRHLIWLLALANLPLLPLLPHVLPGASHPLWSVSSDLISANQISLSLEFAPVKMTGGNQPASSVMAASTAPAVVKSARHALTARLNQNWLALGFIAWTLGILSMLLYFALGQFQLRKFSRTAHVLDTPKWLDLLSESCVTLRLSRRVTLLQSDENVMPLTWGWLRPAVLLPLEADQWPADRRRVVLLHELAHVKRLDCLTQFIARIITALFWFNPLAWLAARQMRIERERACDDLVLNGGCKASDYAGHLVQIARAFRRAPQSAGIAMARSSKLEQRVTAIIDPSRIRRLRPLGLAGVLLAIAAVVLGIGSYSISFARDTGSPLLQKQLTELEQFSKQKLAQSKELMAASGDTMLPDYQKLFDAATAGDIDTVTNLYHSFSSRHTQYSRTKGVRQDPRLRTSYWSPILEIDLAYDQVADCDPKYTEIAANDMVNSISRGAIYFGGTDPGRGIPTAFCKSHVAADPFYTITQNALADGSYLEYLRNTYGESRKTLAALAAARSQDSELSALDKEYQSAMDRLYAVYDKPDNDPELKAAQDACDQLEKKIRDRTDQLVARLKAQGVSPTSDPALGPIPETLYIPTQEDSQKSFQDYTADAQVRAVHDKRFPKEPKQVKSGEEIKVDDEGHTQVSGQIAVMEINGRIAKIVFDKNPGHEFYVEESFPLDWMYPYLQPNGPIMKINRQPLDTMPDEVVQKDREYWNSRAGGMIGDWLQDNTPISKVTDFAEKVFLNHDYSSYGADPRFVENPYAQKMFSKFRSSIAGLYAWRAQHATDAGEKQRMTDAADFAFRQAYALCPYSPEAVFRYVDFLKTHGRDADARLITEAAVRASEVWDPKNNSQLKDLSKRLGASLVPAQTGDSISTADMKLQQLKVSREQIQEVLKKLEAMDHDELEKGLPKAVTDGELNKLLAQRVIAEQDFARVKQEAGPQQPEYQDAETLVKDAQRKVDNRMQGILVGMQAKLDATSAYIDALKMARQNTQGPGN